MNNSYNQVMHRMPKPPLRYGFGTGDGSVMSINMDYNVRFSLTIRSADGIKASFFGKSVILPFAPFIGLRLTENEGVSEPVTSVAWSQSDQKFHCHIDACEVEMTDGYDLDLPFLIERAKTNGWEGKGRIYDINS